MFDPVLLVAHNALIIDGVHNEYVDWIILHQPGDGHIRIAIHSALQFALLSNIEHGRQAVAEFVPSAAVLYVHLPVHLHGVIEWVDR